MHDIILVIFILVYIAGGFFAVKKIGKFFGRNYKKATHDIYDDEIEMTLFENEKNE